MTVEEIGPLGKSFLLHPHAKNDIELSPGTPSPAEGHEEEGKKREALQEDAEEEPSMEEPTYEDEFSLLSFSYSAPSAAENAASNARVPPRAPPEGGEGRAVGRRPSHSIFPKYRRQYKVESIYVNDLYTLTYDEGQTLESLKAIEVHYRRTDREEIRRKLAMGTDDEAFNYRHAKKPSLQSRLQNGKNLQICFMNETASDCESQCSDTESTQDRIDEMELIINAKESKLAAETEGQTMDFASQQARLQAEARLALSQAKEMARMQMEIEKQSQKKSPITEIVRDSFNKIGFPFPASKRRMSRQILTDMNVGQLQVIVNDLHTQIENLNEDLVQLLLGRDDLHMEQDSMLVDIEDLTKHLGAKQRPHSMVVSSSTSGQFLKRPDSLKKGHQFRPISATTSPKTLKLKALVKK